MMSIDIFCHVNNDPGEGEGWVPLGEFLLIIIKCKQWSNKNKIWTSGASRFRIDGSDQKKT